MLKSLYATLISVVQTATYPTWNSITAVLACSDQ
jgi:hypothetical protein